METIDDYTVVKGIFFEMLGNSGFTVWFHGMIFFVNLPFSLIIGQLKYRLARKCLHFT